MRIKLINGRIIGVARATTSGFKYCTKSEQDGQDRQDVQDKEKNVDIVRHLPHKWDLNLNDDIG